MTLNEVADLIVSPQAETLLRGNYVNKRGVRGYFVQIKCGNHWCKVSVSNADHHSARVTVDVYSRVWFRELLPQEEISFDSDVYLLLPKRAQELKSGVQAVEVVPETPETTAGGDMETGAGPLFTPPKAGAVATAVRERTLTIRGEIPTEVWNRLGRTLIPKLKTGNELVMKLDVSVQVESDTAQGFQQELMQILRDLNLADTVKIEIT